MVKNPDIIRILSSKDASILNCPSSFVKGEVSPLQFGYWRGFATSEQATSEQSEAVSNATSAA